MGLVLTRQTEQSVVMTTMDGMRVTVKVVGVHNGNVRLHIDAPSSVDINRSEVEEAIARQRREVVSGAAAATTTPPM